MEFFVGKEEHRARLKICEKCEHKTKINICDLCGCFVAAKAKMKNSKCPEGKWN